MAFPVSPTNGQTYTTALGTFYKYDATRTSWLIVPSTTPSNDLDTGRANTIYMLFQEIDGGNANSTYTSSQVIDCGHASG